MSITRLVGFTDTRLQFSVLNFTYLPWLEGSCGLAHQPKGTCGTDVTKIHKTQMNNWSTYGVFEEIMFIFGAAFSGH